jgi:hypothetical protein
MSGTAAADGIPVGTLIRICALLAAGIAAASLVMFVVDESTAGTNSQVNTVLENKGVVREVQNDTDIDVPAPPPQIERVREQRHSSMREYIDDGNDIVVSPYTGIVSSGSVWAQRLVPALLAIVLFGLGGMMLANMLPKGSNETQDWRESHA